MKPKENKDMGKEATQEATGVSRRDEAMEQIIRAREEERGNAIEEPNPEETEEEPVKEETKEEPKEEMVRFVGNDGTEYLIPKSAKTKFKIDGQEVEDDLDTTFRRYQKGAAGDKRLQDAHEKLKQIQAKEGELTRRESEFQRQMKTAAEKKASGNLSSDDYKKTAKELISALIDADDEKAAELLERVIPAQQKNFLSDDDLEKKLSARELEKARVRFKREFGDLHNDPVLFSRVDAKTAELYSARPDDQYWDIIRDAAEEVRKEVQEEVDANFRARLVALKDQGVRSIDDFLNGKPQTVTKKKSLPTPVSGRVSIGTDEKVPSRADVIAEMRRQRFQP